MRRLLLLMALLVSTMLTAQDAIIKTNGEEIKCTVKKVGSTEIEYHKADNPQGPLYAIARNEVFMIIYANGTRETITQLREVKQAPATVPVRISVTPYDSLMRLSKREKAWGIAGTVIGPVVIAAGATLLALSNDKLDVILGATNVALGAVLTITGPIVIAQGIKHRKQAEQLKSNAMLHLEPGRLLVKF